MAFSYCEYCLLPETNPVHVAYHDLEYGFPSDDDTVLFERLVLEINQAGLSWELILKKREGFRKAYDGFDLAKVAAYSEPDIERLLGDPGIIRNRLKVNAAIENARTINRLVEEHGSFANWLNMQHPLTREEWTKLFKKTFRFTGGEIVNEFLMSLGYLPGAHDETCVVYEKLKSLNPQFLRTTTQ
jgi:DNA-3-methyladenine glycosylase I